MGAGLDFLCINVPKNYEISDDDLQDISSKFGENIYLIDNIDAIPTSKKWPIKNNSYLTKTPAIFCLPQGNGFRIKDKENNDLSDYFNIGYTSLNFYDNESDNYFEICFIYRNNYFPDSPEKSSLFNDLPSMKIYLAPVPTE